jgi:hypothetical protein
MSMTEMAKQLAKQKNAENGPGLTREAVQMEREEFQARVIQEVSRQFAPLSEAIALQSRDLRESMAEFKHMTKRFHEEFRGAIERATAAGADLQDRSRRITGKLWVVMTLTSLGIGALSAYECLKMQPNLSGDRDAATEWRSLQDRFQRLTPTQQRKVNQLLDSNPKH